MRNFQLVILSASWLFCWRVALPAHSGCAIHRQQKWRTYAGSAASGGDACGGEYFRTDALPPSKTIHYFAIRFSAVFSIFPIRRRVRSVVPDRA